MRRDAFQAISDPTRREIIRIIAQESLNLNALADRFSISRPAVSKQIRILHECGLITVRQEGRERFCQANLKPLREVYRWLDQYRVFWNSKLDALEKHLDSTSSKPLRSGKKASANLHSITNKYKK